MSMIIAVKAVIGMVKQSPFQHDLFDFSYIEEQVKQMKKSIPSTKETDEQSLRKLVEEQSIFIKDLDDRLEKIEAKKQKRKWF